MYANSMKIRVCEWMSHCGYSTFLCHIPHAPQCLHVIKHRSVRLSLLVGQNLDENNKQGVYSNTLTSADE